MASSTSLKIILGVANVSRPDQKPDSLPLMDPNKCGDVTRDTTVRYDSPEDVNTYLDAFYDRGGRQLDTARGYPPQAPGTSEERLGTVAAGKRFTIDTKVVLFVPGSHVAAKILESVDNSVELLKTPAINIEYLHFQTAYRAGKFKSFGFSNYTAAEVEEFVKICEEKGFVKPSVYQGQYNPIVRTGEKELFPVLRKHGIVFYAWSPAAAGLFAGNHKNIKTGDRFDTLHLIGQTYAKGYLKDNITAAVDRVIELVEKHGINGHAAALRWTVHHSKLEAERGHAVIIAASNVAQLNSNFDFIEQGPLPDEVLEAINRVHGEVAGSGFPYHA